MKNLLAAAVMAAAMGLPPLGQQHRIAGRPNMPDEVLKPRVRKQAPKKTQVDIDRMELAEAKRQRKRVQRLVAAKKVWAGMPMQEDPPEALSV